MKNEVINAPSGAPAPRPSADPVMDLIAVATRSADVDVDKMARLLELRDKELARRAELAYSRAYARMQAKLPVIGERGEILNKSGKVQSKYALWEDINEAIKPVLTKHGFSLSFRVNTADSVIRVTAVLQHKEGHSEETTVNLPVDVSDYRNPVQSTGSSISYGKRYSAAAILNLVSKDGLETDDDGQAAGLKVISKEQFKELMELIGETNTDVEAFCRYMGVEAVIGLREDQFDRAKSALLAKKGAK